MAAGIAERRPSHGEFHHAPRARIGQDRPVNRLAGSAVAIPHAHSVCVDPATHLVYLPLENVGGRPVLRIMEPSGSR